MSILMHGDHEQRVINLIAGMTGLPPGQVSSGHRLAQDLGLNGDDAANFFREYSKAFDVDMSAFRFENYFAGEPHLFNLQSFRGTYRLTPITVLDLVEAAKRKKWVTPRSVPKHPTHDR